MVEKLNTPLALLPIGAVIGLLGIAASGAFFASSLQGQINELRAETSGQIATVQTNISGLKSDIDRIEKKAVSQRDVLIEIQKSLARVDERMALVEQLIREMREAK